MRVRMPFAAWMRQTRLAKGLSVSECAAAAEVRQPVWTEWEDAAPTKEWRRATVRKIAFALKESETVAMREADKSVVPEAGNSYLSQQLERYLLTIPVSRRAAAERMLVNQAREISELLTA